MRGKSPNKEGERARLLALACVVLFLVLTCQGRVLARQQSSQPEHLAKDPVCGMSVDVHAAKFQSTYEGKTYYFCSGGCKIAFDKEPQKYVADLPESFKAEYEKSPDDITLGLKYGDLLIKDNQTASARPIYERLLKTATTRNEIAEIHFQLGNIARKELKYDEALAEWAIVLDQYKDTQHYSGSILNTAAIRYQVKDELEPAFALMSGALAEGKILDKHMPTAEKLMFMINYDRGDFSAAKANLEKMTEEARQDHHIVDSIWVVYLKTGETAKGEKMLADYYEGIKEDYFALYRLASIAVEAKTKIPEALKWIEHSNELSKGEKFYVLDTYATVLWESGQKNKAVDTLSLAIKLTKKESALSDMTKRLETYKNSMGSNVRKEIK